MRILRRLCRGSEGVSIIEFAMMAPVLTFLLLAGIEMGRYVLLQQKLSRLAISTSDLMSRAQAATVDDIEQVFAAAEYSMTPFKLDAEGIIHITSVTSDDNPGATPRVDWQQSGGGTASHPSKVGKVVNGNGPPAKLPDGFELEPDQNIIVVEVYYDYTPFFFDGVMQPKTIGQIALHRPRLVPLNELKTDPAT
ncbi:MAG: TadE/TadG family type IV pilus assembly protein [Kiloniellales bacterium]|nr:TadE/TadG family type IV pilus assembly protein [Kiloniellales bacterium]